MVNLQIYNAGTAAMVISSWICSPTAPKVANNKASCTETKRFWNMSADGLIKLTKVPQKRKRKKKVINKNQIPLWGLDQRSL